MPADPSIYNAFSQPARSATDYANAFLGQQAQRQAIGVNALKMQGEQQSLDQQQATNNERNAIRSYVAGKDLSDPTVQQGIYQVAPLTGGAFVKSLSDNQKTQADTGKLKADTDLSVANAAKIRTQHAIEVQAQIAQAAGAATDQASWDRGLQIAQTLGADVSQIPKQFDPAVAKTIHDQALTGVEQLDAHFKQMTADETARHNKADESNTVRGQNITASNVAAGIAKDYKVAGLDANGNMPAAAPGQASGSPVQGLVDAVGKGQVSQETALARMPPAMKGNFSTLLAQQYPDFDPTAYGAKAHAAKDFTDGPLGNQMRSNATATAHLDQLSELAAAINNGNVRVVNQIANAYGVQTGQAPVQVFNAVRNIVGQEVVKSIVSGGGGEAERKDAGAAFDPSSSPDQFLQTVGAVKHVMGAQNENLLAQRRAAGLKDSSLPNYNGGKGGKDAPAAPAGFVITHVNGKPQ